MSSNVQIASYLKNCPYFHGVYASDKLPDSLPPGSAIICNTDKSGHPGQHWLALGSLFDPEHPPWYFDSYGFRPDDSDRILQVKTHFAPYLERVSRAAGHGGLYKYNFTALQCEASTTCGELSAFAVIHGLPAEPNGLIKPAWRGLVHFVTAASCAIGDRFVRRLVHFSQ
jgi:hypothetical protein